MTTKNILRAHDRDEHVRPQDDFFLYANGGWMKRNPIPSTEPYWGSFKIVRFKTERQVKTIVEEVADKKRAVAGTPEQMIRDLYVSGMDMKQRNALGLKPLEIWRKKIKDIATVEALHKVIAELHVVGIGVFWDTIVDQDSKQNTEYRLHFTQDGIGLPDRDYYLNDDAESLRIRTAYEHYQSKMMRRLGFSPDDAKAVFSLETRLARAFMKKEDLRDAEKTYHRFTVSQFQKRAPQIDWKMYLTRIGAKNSDSVIVMQPEYFSFIATHLEKTPLSVLKAYLEWHLLNESAGALSSELRKESFAFYGTVLIGLKKMKPLWRQVMAAVDGSLSEVIGQLYVKKYFPPAAKREMNILVDDLFAAYEERIKKIEWMSPATKKKALAKLHAMSRKIGYPDKWKSYRGLVIVPDDFVGNLMRSTAYEHARQMRKLGKPIDLDEWYCSPQTVNAFYNPPMNDMLFPAGILQPPFFTLGGDDAVNYGAIGTVIGHEMTHGFDDQGAKFNAKGSMQNWWTAGDKKKFTAKAKLLKEQFDRYTVADGVKVNGQLTLGENIADLGGAVIAYDAYMRRLQKTGRKVVGGLSPEQRFFLGFALFERQNTRPEFEKMAARTDVHAPHNFRINGPMSNLNEFYEAYAVKKGDKLYREPKDRAKIW